MEIAQGTKTAIDNLVAALKTETGDVTAYIDALGLNGHAASQLQDSVTGLLLQEFLKTKTTLPLTELTPRVMDRLLTGDWVKRDLLVKRFHKRVKNVAAWEKRRITPKGGGTTSDVK